MNATSPQAPSASSSPAPQPRSRRARRFSPGRRECVIAVLAAVLFVAWGNAWLFREDFWGIDDPTYLRLIDDVHSILRSEGPRAAWNHLRTYHGNNYGPVVSLYVYATCSVFGHHSQWPYHLLKGLQHAGFLLCIWGAARNLGARRLGSFTAVLFAALANSTIAMPDMQTYSANWWRLYTTDSHGAFPLAAFFYLVSLATLRHSRRSRIAILLAAAACFWVTMMTKGIYLYLVGGVAVAAALLAAAGAWKHPRYRLVFAYLALLVLLGLHAIPVYGVSSAGVKIKMYAEPPSFAWDRLAVGVRVYVRTLLDIGFWLWAVPVVWAASHCARWLRGVRPFATMSRVPRVIVIAALASGIGGMVLQSSWPIVIPRYMISFVPPLALAAGVAIGVVLRRARQLQRRDAGRYPLLGRLAFWIPALLFFLGVAALYYPTSRPAWVRVAPALALWFIPFAGLVVGPLFRRKRPAIAALYAPLLRGMILATLLLQTIVLALNYYEARVAFRTFYRGTNALKSLLRAAQPALDPSAPIHFHCNLAGEFRDNTLWFLQAYENLPRFTVEPADDFDEIRPPALVFLVFYPHPINRSLWIPPGSGEWRYAPWFATGTHSVKALAQAPQDQPIVIDLPAHDRPVALGRVAVRFDTRTLPWTRRVVIRVIDQEDHTLGEACFRGLEAPRQQTNTVPINFDPPLQLPAAKRHRISVAVEPDPLLRPHPLGLALLLNEIETLFLLMAPSPDDTQDLRVGVEVFLAEPWIADRKPEREWREHHEVATVHVDSPAAVLLSVLRVLRYPSTLPTVRPVLYSMNASLVYYAQSTVPSEP